MHSRPSFTPPVGGILETTDYANDTLLGFDNTNDFIPVPLSSSDGRIPLASLTLDASITSTGESFTVSLVPPSGSGSSGEGVAGSYFNVVDSSSNEWSAVPYTSTSGTVTITAAAVPEPAPIVSGRTALVILASVHGTGRVRRSARRST